jgi:hypothetical protein
MPCAGRTSARYGEITTTPVEPTLFGEGGPLQVTCEPFLMTWRPPARIHENLPGGFQLEFDVFVAADGTRSFVPVGGFGQFLPTAFLAGIAIRMLEEGLDEVDRNWCFARHQIFQRVRRMPEHLNRRFDTSRDLFVRKGGRGGGIGRSLLPEGVSFDAATSKPVGIKERARRGRELALAAGLKNPTNPVAIHYGLVEAARMHPLRLTHDEDATRLMRTALFEESSIGPAPADKVIEIVMERLVTWIDRHLDLPRDQFDRAFFPGKSNFTKAIADQRRSRGGMLPRDDVRRAILQLGWQAYTEVGDAMVRCMNWLAAALPEPLCPNERRLFEQMYFPHGYLGGLPLALLVERAGFIKNVISELWDDPGDPLLIGTLHRLLDFYRQMVTDRREADCRFKKNRRDDGQVAHTLSSQDWRAVETGSADDVSDAFGAVAEFLADRHGWRCTHCGGDWSARLVEEPDSVGRPGPATMIQLEVVCRCGRTHEEAEISVAEFQRVAQPIVAV